MGNQEMNKFEIIGASVICIFLGLILVSRFIFNVPYSGIKLVPGKTIEYQVEKIYDLFKTSDIISIKKPDYIRLEVLLVDDSYLVRYNYGATQKRFITNFILKVTALKSTPIGTEGDISIKYKSPKDIWNWDGITKKSIDLKIVK